MNRILFFIVSLGCLTLAGCVGASGEGETAEEDIGIQPQSGDWTILTTGWTNDDCNADENLTDSTSITFSDVDSSSFQVTYFENGVQVGSGNNLCSHEGDDIYSCEEFTNGFSYTDVDASISMASVSALITLSSETTASGSADLVMECEGADCSLIASYTTSGVFPCDTTYNWTAEAD